jgi:PAS domain S-box-containing protein
MSRGLSQPQLAGFTSSARRDLLVLLAAGAIAFAIAISLDLGEHLDAWAEARETWELDEVTLVLDGLILGLAWFSLRRWREARREAAVRSDVAGALAQEVAERRAGEERYRALVAASASIVWRAGPDGAIIEGMSLGASEVEATRLAGDWLGHSLHPEDRDRVARLWREAIAAGHAGRIEYRARDPDGQNHWFAMNAVPIRDRDGGVREWVGTLTGTDHEKQAQAAVQEREERLRLATEAAGLGTYVVDLVTGERHWSREMRLVLGVAADAPLSREAYRGLIHPEDRGAAEAGFDRRIASTDGPVEAQYRIVRPDTGERRWVSEFSRTHADETGRPVRLVGTLRDITREKEAELALRESEERYRLLAENATDLISRVGLDGTRLYVSPSAYDLLGYEPAELIGSELTSLTHPGDAARVHAATQALLASPDGQQTIAYRLRHRKGHWIMLESHRRLVRDEAGRPVEFVSVARDVTEQRRLEEQLRQSQKMEAVGQLTGGIAHDFNNLLTVVIGNAEILAEDLPDPRHRTLAQIALDAAEKGAELTRHLLAFGRRQTLKPERLDLAQVVQRLEPLLRRTVGEHIELVTTLGAGATVALTDRTLLESALLNLVVNARDAMPQGGTLTLETGERVAHLGEGQLPAGQPVVFVTVADTGAGIPPELLSRVFDPFFTTKEAGKGSGLGLSMVYGFAQQSGGHAEIRSEVGQGTAVTLLLRAVSALPAEAPAGPVPGPAGGPERILAVEDEDPVRRFVCAQLETLGYAVTAVATAAEALELLNQGRPFDLLFTDVVLPKGMSGVELARLVRTLRPRLKVVLTSGYAEDAFEHHGRPEPGTPLLRKPYRRKDLADTIRAALDPGRSPTPP